MVKETFVSIAEQELVYRNLQQTDAVRVLEDIFETASIIAFRGTTKQDYFEELNEGIKKIIHFIYSKH